jgi:hypothetical protein
MKSFKLFNEKCNNKKNFKNNTIRKNSEKSQEFGQIRKVGKQSEKTSKFGNFRKIRMIWQPCVRPTVGRTFAENGDHKVFIEYPGCFDDARIMHELLHTLGNRLKYSSAFLSF